MQNIMAGIISQYPKLYKDDDYLVLDIQAGILFLIVNRGLTMFLAYETWQELKRIIDNVKIPDSNGTGAHVIAQSGPFQVHCTQKSGSAVSITLALMDRALRLDFRIDEWKKFHSMILDADNPEQIYH
jgi:hypothetical protein